MFAPTFVHTVKIWNQQLDGTSCSSYCSCKRDLSDGCLERLEGTFDLKWQDTNDDWHQCPGSPYYYPAKEGPISFNCPTSTAAKAIRIEQHKTGTLRMAEVEVYSTCVDNDAGLPSGYRISHNSHSAWSWVRSMEI